MSNFRLIIGLGVSLATAAPGTASADIGDAIAGGVVGAVLNQVINNASQPKQQVRKTRKAAPAATLNGQYSRSERYQIQSALNSMGYGVGTVDGVLGRRSRNAISGFQSTRGEAATGQLTRAQFYALVSIANGGSPVMASQRQLQPGEVVMLQQSLQRLGYYRGAIDGMAGGGTARGVAAFLSTQNRNPYQTSPVEALALAGMASGYQLPPYILQEASAGLAGQGFTQQNAAGFAQQPAQGFTGNQGYGVQQPQQAIAPQQIDPFAQQPATGVPATAYGTGNGQFQQQPAAVAPGPGDVYAGTGQNQPTPLFAATANTAPAPQAVAQPQSSLDIFSGTNVQQQQQPAPVAVVAQQPVAPVAAAPDTATMFAAPADANAVSPQTGQAVTQPIPANAAVPIN